MKSKSTIVWFLFAGSLFAFIWIFEHYLQPAPPTVEKILPGFHADAATAVQIYSRSGEISAVRTNGAWQLEKPVDYPAQSIAIQTFLNVLENLTAMQKFSAADLRNQANADAEYGFENPQFSIDVTAGEHQWHLRIGDKTAPGDQVFIRLVGANGAFVTDAAWLQTLPPKADVWRDTALISSSQNVDWIIITNGTKAVELKRDVTNHLWRMLRPLDARADNERINLALQQLRAVHATKFIAFDPKADLTAYGLQPADLDLWLGEDTNLTDGIHVEKISPDKPAQIYVRRDGWDTVLAIPSGAFAAWRGTVNEFRDPFLFELATPVAEIEVDGTNPFVLQQRGSNDWAVAGEKFPVDIESVQTFLKLLASLRISEFVKDTATPTDLQAVGLAPPSRQIILRSAAGDTNSAMVQLLFGATETNRVFVKRTAEDSIYAITPENFNVLFGGGGLYDQSWQFRDRRIWNFSETNVISVTLRQNGQTNLLVRTGENKWTLAAGNGFINPPAVEETVHRLGELAAAGWVGRNFIAPEKYGFGTNHLQLAVMLKNGDQKSLDFGVEFSQTALAAVTLDDERWAFVFPPALYQLVAAYLTIPPPAH